MSDTNGQQRTDWLDDEFENLRMSEESGPPEYVVQSTLGAIYGRLPDVKSDSWMNNPTAEARRQDCH